MSKGLKTTIALGGMMLAMAAGTGAMAQGAKEYGNTQGAEWDLGAPDPMAITWPRVERAQPYSETVQGRNEPTTATGYVGDVSPKRKVRSGD
jgi:hypothetical protein